MIMKVRALGVFSKRWAHQIADVWIGGLQTADVKSKKSLLMTP